MKTCASYAVWIIGYACMHLAKLSFQKWKIRTKPTNPLLVSHLPRPETPLTLRQLRGPVRVIAKMAAFPDLSMCFLPLPRVEMSRSGRALSATQPARADVLALKVQTQVSLFLAVWTKLNWFCQIVNYFFTEQNKVSPWAFSLGPWPINGPMRDYDLRFIFLLNNKDLVTTHYLPEVALICLDSSTI